MTTITSNSTLEIPTMNNFMKESFNNKLEQTSSLQSLSFASSPTSILKKQTDETKNESNNTKKRTFSPDDTTSTLIIQEPTEQPPLKKKKTKKVRKWQKPKDKPKRPLSSYNLFFANERQKMIDERDAANNAILPTTKGKTTKKGTGFGNMAKTIGDKWNVLDDESRAVYEEQAQKLKQEYLIAIEQWKHNKAQKEKENQDKEFAAQIKKVHSPLPTLKKFAQQSEPTPHQMNSLIHQMQFNHRQQLHQQHHQQQQHKLLSPPTLPTFPFTSASKSNDLLPVPIHTSSQRRQNHQQQQQSEPSLGEMLSGWCDDFEAEEENNGSNCAVGDIFDNKTITADNDDEFPTPFDCSSNNNAYSNNTAAAGGNNILDEEESSQLLAILSEDSSSESSSSDDDDNSQSLLNRMLETSLELLERSREIGALSTLDNDESCAFLSALDYTVPVVVQ